SGSDEPHYIIVRVNPGEGNLDRGRQIPVIQLRNQQGSGQIDAELSRGKRIGSGDLGEFFGIRDLQTLSEGIGSKRSGGDIEKTDGILDVDWDAELARTSFYQGDGALANTG